MEAIRKAYRWHQQRFRAGAVVLGIIFWAVTWAVWGFWWFIFLIIIVMLLEMAWVYGLERLHQRNRAK